MSEVIDEIEQENEWRNKDFAKFKAHVEVIDEKLWCRMCVPLIYAHWEGFVVSALKILINYLNSLKLTPTQVPTNLIVFGLGDTYNALNGKQRFDQKITFTNKFYGLFEKELCFSSKVDTKANLKTSVLKDIYEIFGFDFEKIKQFEGELDLIVAIRNRIAHGEDGITPDIQNISNYIDTINKIKDSFLLEIDAFIKEEKYLRK